MPAPESTSESPRSAAVAGPVATLRGLRRLLAVLAWTGFMYVLYIAGGLPSSLLGRGAPWRARVLRLWGRVLVRLLGGRRRVTGTPPEGSFLLVCNHVSYVDIPLLAGCTGTLFLSKAEVARWPVVGFLARAAGTVFLDRERKRELPKALAELRARLARGDAVTFFPEGTSTHGGAVAPFRPSLLAVAAEGDLPVRVAALRYRTRPPAPPASDAVAWWGDADFAPHVWSLLCLPGFEAEVAFGERSLHDTDRKRLAAELETAVASLLPPP